MSGSRECKVCNTVNSSAPALQAGVLPVHQLLTGDNSCQIRAPCTESRNKSRLFACRDCYYLESKNPPDSASLQERVLPELLWIRAGQMFQGGCITVDWPVGSVPQRERKELDGLLCVLVINLLVCQGSFLIC